MPWLVQQQMVSTCLVDNSAALHLCHKKGPGRLRHIAGKLLWVQDLVAQEELKVKSVGTVYNVADLGTKPLSRARIQLILFWCRVNNKEHERLGRGEHDRVVNEQVSKGKIARLAKLLNRILLLEGLEHVAGNYVDEKDMCMVEENRSWSSMASLAVSILLALVMILAGVIYMLWKSLREVKRDLQELKEDCKTDGMMISAVDYDVKEVKRQQDSEKAAMKTMAEYMLKLHRGLIKNDGFVDEGEMADEDWKHWDYLQRSNRNYNLQRLKAQAKDHLIRKCIDDFEDEEIDLAGAFPDDVPGEELELGETAQVRLDSGEVVDIPMEYLQRREPESDPEDNDVEQARQAERKRQRDEKIEEIKKMRMEDLGDLDLPEGRSGLRAKEHMEQLHQEWLRADRAGDAAGRLLVHKKMERHQGFLDSPMLRF